MNLSRLNIITVLVALAIPGCSPDLGLVEPVPKSCVALDFWFKPGRSGWDFQRLSARLMPVKGNLPPISIPHEIHGKRGPFMWVRLNRVPSDSDISGGWLKVLTDRALEVSQGADMQADEFDLLQFKVTDEHQRALFSWGSLRKNSDNP